MREALEKELNKLGLEFPNVSGSMGVSSFSIDAERAITSKLPVIPAAKRQGLFKMWILWDKTTEYSRPILAFSTGTIEENSDVAKQIALLMKSWLFDKDSELTTLSFFNNSRLTLSERHANQMQEFFHPQIN